MNEQANVDELLSSFIDGELTERQRIEVQRLISHDAEAAGRFQRLEKCRMLVNSLPRADAPADMLERVKAGLEARRLTLQQTSVFEQRRGALHLFARKVLTAAAMIGLASVLAVVVYTIVAPVETPNRGGAGVDVTLAGTVAPTPFYASLELEPSSSAAVSAFNRAINDNGLSECFTPATQGSKGVYTLTCSRADFKAFLGDLTDSWDRFGSRTLSVETDRFAERVTIRSVSLSQIAEIVNQNSLDKRLELARDVSLANWMDQLMPGREIEVALGGENDLIIPKPRFVGPAEPVRKSPDAVKDSEKVQVTIVFVGVE
jgi:negative regulator of sigma E activity